MARQTGIEYVDATHNFWVGCTSVSPGCKNCFARRITTRFGQDFSNVQRTQRFDEPMKWKTSKRILTCSMSDFFHEDADEWRDEAWRVIKSTPQHTYLILTKRPERIEFPKIWCGGMGKRPKRMPICPENVWLGISAEDQEQLEKRWGHLSMHPAPVWFISVEPALGPINFERAAKKVFGRNASGLRWRTKAHWVIVGGESGPGARPMHPEWARSIRDQCQAAGVPYFFKQHGEWSVKGRGDPSRDFANHRIVGMDGSQITMRCFEVESNKQWPWILMHRIGKEKAGRILDKRKWSEIPE